MKYNINEQYGVGLGGPGKDIPHLREAAPTHLHSTVGMNIGPMLLDPIFHEKTEIWITI